MGGKNRVGAARYSGRDCPSKLGSCQLGGNSLRAWRDIPPSLERKPFSTFGGNSFDRIWRDVPPRLFGGMSLQGGMEGCPSKVVWRGVPPRWSGGMSLQGFLEGRPSKQPWRDVPPSCLKGRPSKVLVLVRKIEITDSFVENFLNFDS